MAETVPVGEVGPAVAGAGDLTAALYTALFRSEQHVHRPAIAAPGIIADGADSQVGDAVAVHVPQRRQRKAETVSVSEGGPAVAGAGDLSAALDRAVGVQQQDVHRPAIAAPGII